MPERVTEAGKELGQHATNLRGIEAALQATLRALATVHPEIKEEARKQLEASLMMSTPDDRGVFLEVAGHARRLLG